MCARRERFRFPCYVTVLMIAAEGVQRDRTSTHDSTCQSVSYGKLPNWGPLHIVSYALYMYSRVAVGVNIGIRIVSGVRLLRVVRIA